MLNFKLKEVTTYFRVYDVEALKNILLIFLIAKVIVFVKLIFI